MAMGAISRVWCAGMIAAAVAYALHAERATGRQTESETQLPQAQSAAPVAPAQAASRTGVDDVRFRATLGCPTYNEHSRECLLLKVDYSASGATPIARPPLNIALVLDQSGSMAQERKLGYTIEAARWIVQNMTARDVLSIVAFNEQAVVLAAAGAVVNKPFLYHRLEEVFPGGYTNLSAGLLEGLAQTRGRSAEGQLRHVLLLTDGLANRGDTTADALRRIVREAATLGIGVSTFGVGFDFNERLLADLAAVGRGRYAYIRSPDQIPVAFQNELRGLLQVVARDAVIRLTLTEGHILKTYGQLPAPPTRSQVLAVGDLRATEQGFVLAELEPAAFAFGTTIQGEASLDFRNPRTGERHSRVIPLRSSYVVDPHMASRTAGSGLAVLASILSALEQAHSAVQGLDVARYAQLKDSFSPLYEQAREFAIRNRDQELLNQVFVLKHFMEELEAAEKEGLLHGHEAARERLGKENHYLQYLLTHHRPESVLK